MDFTAEHVLVPGAQPQHTSLQACLSCHSGSGERWGCLAATSVYNIVSVADGDLLAVFDFQAPNQPGKLKQSIQTDKQQKEVWVAPPISAAITCRACLQARVLVLCPWHQHVLSGVILFEAVPSRRITPLCMCWCQGHSSNTLACRHVTAAMVGGWLPGSTVTL